MKKLFHREIYMPKSIAGLSEKMIQPEITGHAYDAARADRYGILNIPRVLVFTGADIVEAETTDGKLSKIVVRLPYDDTRDAVYVVAIDGARTFYKTVWFNVKTDSHKTLRRNLYATS